MALLTKLNLKEGFMESTSKCFICGKYAPADYKGDRPGYTLNSRDGNVYRFCVRCYLNLEQSVLNKASELYETNNPNDKR
jgi:hypothetical protein